MIKVLQRKFILVAMSSFALVVLIIISAVNIGNAIQVNRQINMILNTLSENNGRFPKMDGKKRPKKNELGFHFQMTEETPYETRYFTVETNTDGSIKQIDTSHIAAVSSEQAMEYAEEVISGQADSGTKGIYRYITVDKNEGSMILFLDCRQHFQTSVQILWITLGIGALSLLCVFFLIITFSKKIIRPVIDSMEKQKQFITNAGHEIKTPLAIISANTDVMEISTGESEWIDSIRKQIARLDGLVKNLLTLSKMDEEKVNLAFTEFSISNIVWEEASSFEAVAEMKKKRFELNIQPGIIYNGDENNIRQLVSILVDNAVKYSDENGEIKVSLSVVKKKIKLKVYNTSIVLDKGKLNHMFDRFYRGDSSRSSETGGYGIGLSIAQSVVHAHSGRISVSSEDGKSVCFTVVL